LNELFGVVWFDSLSVFVSTITAILTVGHRFKSTPTNGPRFTASGLPWWSPIQVRPGAVKLVPLVGVDFNLRPN